MDSCKIKIMKKILIQETSILRFLPDMHMCYSCEHIIDDPFPVACPGCDRVFSQLLQLTKNILDGDDEFKGDGMVINPDGIRYGAIPEVKCSPTISHGYFEPNKKIQLGASVINRCGPVTNWEWITLSIPPDSGVDFGSSGDFLDGESHLQCPYFVPDMGGTYVFQAKASNPNGYSIPEEDKENGQQIVYIKMPKEEPTEETEAFKDLQIEHIRDFAGDEMADEILKEEKEERIKEARKRVMAKAKEQIEAKKGPKEKKSTDNTKLTEINRGVFICENCSQRFWIKPNEEHPFNCHRCGKYFAVIEEKEKPPRQTQQTRLIETKQNGVFKCSHCERFYTANPEVPLPEFCDGCARLFTGMVYYDDQKETIPCSLCSYKHPAKSGAWPHDCEVCEDGFKKKTEKYISKKRKSKMNDTTPEIKTTLIQLDSDVFKCKNCDHIIKVPHMATPSAECVNCGAIFVGEIEKTKFERIAYAIHTGNGSYRCPDCDTDEFGWKEGVDEVTCECGTILRHRSPVDQKADINNQLHYLHERVRKVEEIADALAEVITIIIEMEDDEKVNCRLSIKTKKKSESGDYETSNEAIIMYQEPQEKEIYLRSLHAMRIKMQEKILKTVSSMPGLDESVSRVKGVINFNKSPTVQEMENAKAYLKKVVSGEEKI